MIVDGTVEQVGVAALGEVQQLVAGQRDLGPFQQGGQQTELTGGQWQGDAVGADQFALAGIERPVAEPDAFRAGRGLARRQGLGPAQHGGDTRHQFAGEKGLEM